MQLLDDLAQRAAAMRLDFMVVGGHAVNAYGIGRQTADLDLMIRECDGESWRQLLELLGYRLIHKHKAFLQFTGPDLGHWPVDLMLVDDATFGILYDAGHPVEFGGRARPRVPSVLHLIALKLHALKQAGPMRELQDLPDIVALVEAGHIDSAAPDFREYCLRYGAEPIYDQIVDQCLRRAT